MALISSSYEDVYNILLGKIRDYDLLNLSLDEFDNLMTEKARSVFANPNFRGKFNKFSVYEDIRTITYELTTSVDDGYDKWFVEEAIAEGLTIQWLRPYVNNALVLNQFVGTAREKYFSQAAHLKQVEERLHQAELSFERLLTTHGYWNNSYFTES